jgi:pSer/pThr/pTyr-binding forkhead associated (FHA) protein
MPEGKKISIAVIQGNQVGEVFKITKPRVIIGRSGADFILNDLEASRQHAAIEIMGDRILLRDLGSTNGTFVDEKPITTAYLDNQSEFRIGTTVFMLIITE